ncbi:fimbria/pilus outer membrane usher protein [Sphingomonas kaistensis]|uniref:Fimbria/pilus outer membrane usher protein n=1 Tax=Sphingomonas kaistensis TaxID=298708 RepID=A0ABZ2G0U5_9SPHN
MSSLATIKPVGLVLNGLPQEQPTLVGTVGGQLAMLRDDLIALGIIVPPMRNHNRIGEQDFVRVSDVAGLSGRLSEDEDALLLTASPSAFVATRRSARVGAAAPPVSTILPLGFLVYDVSLANERGGIRASGLFDAGASGSWGVAGTTLLLAAGGKRPVRLDNSFQRDFPAQRLRLVIGDSFTRASDFNGSARFGGVRIGTDFALAPGEIGYPLPVLAGSALVPSTVELLAASGRQSHEVGPGRFLIEAPPVISGAGEVVMTIADVTGAVRQVRQSFYTSNRLIRPGLTDFSLEVGALRRRYGQRSASYGPAFAALGLRRGLNSSITAGARIEASQTSVMGGATVNAVVGRVGEIAVAGALSRSGARAGSLWRAQAQRLGPRGSFLVSYLRSNGTFARVGDDRAALGATSRHEFSATAGLVLPVGQISVGVVDAGLRDGSRYRLASAGYSASVRSVFLSASLRASRLNGGTDKGFFLSLSRPLGRHGSAALTADKGQVTSSYQWSAPDRQGVSFGVASTRSGGDMRFNGYALALSSFGDLEMTAFRADRRLAMRASARGALVLIEGRLVPTPRLHDGFALVEVESKTGVRILQEGRPVARRARAGRPVLLTGLQPFAANRVGIRTEDLPLDIDLDDDEGVAVPGFRQAALVRFGTTEARAPRTIALVDEQGRPIGPGFEVMLDDQRIGVTGHDGLVFLAGGGDGQRLRVKTTEGRCEAMVPVLRSTSSLGPAAPIVCRPSPRERAQ